MPPKEKKKKKKAKAPMYLAGEADLAPFGVKANQLVRNVLGMVGTVLGVRTDASGQAKLWVQYQQTGVEAPVEGPGGSGGAFAAEGVAPLAAPGGFVVASAAVHIKRDAAALAQERAELETKWQVHNADAAKLAAAASKKKGKKKQAAAPPPAHEGEAPATPQGAQPAEQQVAGGDWPPGDTPAQP